MAVGAGGRLVGLMVSCLLLAACTGGESVAVDETTPVESVTEVVVEPTATATAVPESVELSDGAKIAAAVAAFDADPQPTDLIAHDHLGASVRGTTGLVDLRVCGWTGETVFDDVYVVAYRVNTGADGTAEVTFESVNTTVNDDCINTELVESAFEFISEYDQYRTLIAASPRKFSDTEALEFYTPDGLAVVARASGEQAENDLSYRGSFLDGRLPQSAVVDVLGRRYQFADAAVLDIVSCRPMADDFGLYQGDVLIDDFRTESSLGNHGLYRYQLGREQMQWVLVGEEDRAWVNCLGFSEGWVAGANDVLVGPVPWQVIAP